MQTCERAGQDVLLLAWPCEMKYFSWVFEYVHLGGSLNIHAGGGASRNITPLSNSFLAFGCEAMAGKECSVDRSTDEILQLQPRILQFR